MLAPYGSRSLRQLRPWLADTFLLASLAVPPTVSHPSPRYAPLSPTHRQAISCPLPPASETQPPAPIPLDPHKSQTKTPGQVQHRVQMHGSHWA